MAGMTIDVVGGAGTGRKLNRWQEAVRELNSTGLMVVTSNHKRRPCGEQSTIEHEAKNKQTGTDMGVSAQIYVGSLGFS